MLDKFGRGIRIMSNLSVWSLEFGVWSLDLFSFVISFESLLASPGIKVICLSSLFNTTFSFAE